MWDIEGVCLRTPAEQREGGDEHPVNPLFLQFDLDHDYMIFREFNLKERPVGRARVFLRDNRLVAQGTLWSYFPDLPYLSIGFRHGAGNGSNVLTDLAVTSTNTDHGIPLYYVKRVERAHK